MMVEDDILKKPIMCTGSSAWVIDNDDEEKVCEKEAVYVYGYTYWTQYNSVYV